MTPEKFDPNLPPAGQQPTISPYGFILNPEKNIVKKSPLGIKDPFLQKLLLIVVGAAVLLLAVIVVVNVFFGSKSGIEQLVGISQTQQEIIRINRTYVSQLNSQELKNASTNVQVSIQSDQKALLEIVAKSGTKTDAKILALKRDTKTDEQFTVAKSTNIVDTVFTQVLEAELETYQQEIKIALDSDFGPNTKKILSNQFAHVTLLREQLNQ